jgi:sulfonate transport system permease protein
MEPISSSADIASGLPAAELPLWSSSERRVERVRPRAVSWRGLTAYALPVLLYTLWWVASHRQWMSPQILPTPEQVWETGGELLSDNLIAQLLVSVKRLVFGVTAGVSARGSA